MLFSLMRKMVFGAQWLFIFWYTALIALQPSLSGSLFSFLLTFQLFFCFIWAFFYSTFSMLISAELTSRLLFIDLSNSLCYWFTLIEINILYPTLRAGNKVIYFSCLAKTKQRTLSSSSRCSSCKLLMISCRRSTRGKLLYNEQNI